MRARILLTGFGPFPGAPVNPTGPLVRALARRLARSFPNVDIATTVFTTSYAVVDRRLPKVLAKYRPDAVVMFGLATRAHHLRIETQARNALSRKVDDATGVRPRTARIDASGPARRAGRAPFAAMLKAALAKEGKARLSRNAGNYLCNYAYWRALEATPARGGPMVAFVHVPPLTVATMGEIVRVGEAIMTTLNTALARRRSRNRSAAAL